MRRPIKEGSREVIQADAISWLQEKGVMPGCSFVTSLPDFSEFPSLSLLEWKAWFEGAARQVLLGTPTEGVTIFYQRDSKQNGAWIDKSFLIQKAAESLRRPLLWHKIVCRAPAGYTTFGKPSYSHLLCFSEGVRLELANSTTDIIPVAGESTWTRGMGVKVCEVVCSFLRDQTTTSTLVDPFCGHGLLLAVANRMGLDSIGVDKGRKRVERARDLKTEDTLSFR